MGKWVINIALKKFCLHQGCATLVDSGRCDKHSNDIQVARQQYDKHRPEWHSMYKDPRYQKARTRYLQRHPLCVECEEIGQIVPATILDHIIDHKGDYDLFWDESNWQGLCESDHNSKTAKTNNK